MIASPETRLALAAVSGLAGDHRTGREPIQVSVQNDVIVLAGSVRSWTARATAGAVARSAPGAHDVCNVLKVQSMLKAPRADPFDRIVAGWCHADRRKHEPGQGRRPLAYTVPAGLWLLLTVAAVALGMPSGAALTITLIGAASVLAVRRMARLLPAHSSRNRH